MKIKHIISILSVLVLSIGMMFFISHKNRNQMQTETVNTTTQTIMSDAAVKTAYSVSSNENYTNTTKATSLDEEMQTIESQAPNLDKNVLKLSLTAYEHAKNKGVTDNSIITIVDYSKPSTEKRLWVVDLSNNKVLFNTWVAHGKNSGEVNSTSFSNTPESLKSSIGVFVTDTSIYTGKHGDSLRVQGLEAGFNDNAFKRDIVFHGAPYVSQAIAKAGRLGRSWGCWAVSPNIISSLVHTIRNKVLVIAYYPDKKWLNQSTFLN